MITRRQYILSLLFGTGLIGLRSLVTGLPAGFFLSLRRALGATTPTSCAAKDKAQFIVFFTSGNGDPINSSVPGTYLDPLIVHSSDPSMAPTT